LSLRIEIWKRAQWRLSSRGAYSLIHRIQTSRISLLTCRDRAVSLVDPEEDNITTKRTMEQRYISLRPGRNREIVRQNNAIGELKSNLHDLQRTIWTNALFAM
jgi:hypothetical protein